MVPDVGLFAAFPVIFAVMALVVVGGIVFTIVKVVGGGASSVGDAGATPPASHLLQDMQQQQFQQDLIQQQLMQQQITQQQIQIQIQISQAAATSPPSGPPTG